MPTLVKMRSRSYDRTEHRHMNLLRQAKDPQDVLKIMENKFASADVRSMAWERIQILAAKAASRKINN